MNWDCIGGGRLTYAYIFDRTLSVIPEGNKAAYFGNLKGYPCSINNGLFDTSCIISTSCMITGIPNGFPQSDTAYGGPLGVSLEQTVSGLIKGNTYVLEFWAGGETNGLNFYLEGLFALDIGFGNNYLRCKPTSSDIIERSLGLTYLIQFKATSTSHKIKFTNWGHIEYHHTELVLDNVRLYSLSELSPSVTPCLTATDDQNEDNQILVYPNPVIDEVNITSNFGRTN